MDPPSNSIIPHPKYPISSRAYIPIDDDNTFVFGTSFNPDAPMTQEEREYLETGLGAAPETIPGTFTPVINRDNNYMLDRDSQRAGNSTGIPGVNNQDRAIVESMGPIVDRENEHLGTTDKAIISSCSWRKTCRMALSPCSPKPGDVRCARHRRDFAQR